MRVKHLIDYYPVYLWHRSQEKEAKTRRVKITYFGKNLPFRVGFNTGKLAIVEKKEIKMLR